MSSFQRGYELQVRHLMRTGIFRSEEHLLHVAMNGLYGELRSKYDLPTKFPRLVLVTDEEFILGESHD